QVMDWQNANLQVTERSRRLMQLAGQAERILPDADPATKRRVLELLDVRVHVTGWERCDTCDGTGWVSKFRPGDVPKTPSGRPAAFCGVECRTCQRHRHVPSFEIEGTVPEVDLQPALTTPETSRLPFKVVAGSA